MGDSALADRRETMRFVSDLLEGIETHPDQKVREALMIQAIRQLGRAVDSVKKTLQGVFVAVVIAIIVQLLLRAMGGGGP